MPECGRKLRDQGVHVVGLRRGDTEHKRHGKREKHLCGVVHVAVRGYLLFLKIIDHSFFLLMPTLVVRTIQHAYLSEGSVPSGLKNAMQKAIRRNRLKHDRHLSASNVDVIQRCTHMW